MNERLLAELDRWIEEAEAMRNTTEQIYFSGQRNAFVRVRDWIRKNQEQEAQKAHGTANVRGLPGGANLLPSVSNHH